MEFSRWFSLTARQCAATVFAGVTLSMSALAGEPCVAGGCAAITGPEVGCADVGCGDAGCGEAIPSGCGYGLLDLKSLFADFSADPRLFGDLSEGNLGDVSYKFGGEMRYRHMDERNRLRPPAAAHTNYDQWRFTPFVSLTYKDSITGYVQAIDASMTGLDAPYTPLSIDVNRTDLLQAYVDIKVADLDDGKLTYRYGRQMLKYGGQRLVSPLAWGNTFRNFEGHKLMYTSSDWDIDGFAVQSVNGAAGNIFRPQSFDHADQSRWLMGAYATYKGFENNAVDFYYLHFDEDAPSTTLMDGTRHTIGMRVAGKQPVKNCGKLMGTWDWDLEGAYQFGEDNFGSAALRNVQAGMLGALGGYTFESAPWKPGIGGIFYYSSGSNDPTTGTINTFYSMYPLGHAYWGQIDNLSGQNLLNYGVQLTTQPMDKLKVVTQWHYFELAQATDRIYNIAGAGLAGGGSAGIGNELDIVGTYTVNKNLNVQLGQLWFFYGNAVTGGPLARPDARQTYLQVTYAY